MAYMGLSVILLTLFANWNQMHKSSHLVFVVDMYGNALCFLLLLNERND
jgi:hypothetical protein